MSKHVIFMYNSYFCKKKIALHYCDDNDKKYVEIIDIVKNKFPHINFNIHVVSTDSIYKADSYFDCTEFFGYDDYMEFIKLVERDVNIDAIDVAKVILCKKSLSHLELQKILFFVAKELITKYDIQLFKEEFESWNYGTVVPSVYHKYKKIWRKKYIYRRQI